MNITYQTSDIEMTDALSQYITKRLGDLDKLFSKPQAQVHIRKEPPSQKNGDGLFHISVAVRDNSEEYRADSNSHDMYVAIDQVKDDLQRVVRKERGAQDSIFKRSARKIKNMMKGM